MTSPSSDRSRSRHVAVVVGLVLTAGIVALHLAYHRHAGALWRDEVNGVNVASLPSLAEVYAHSPLESFPVAWVLVLHAWIRAGLGTTDPELRRLGLSIGLATVALVWWSGRRLGLAAPLLTLLLFCASPTLVVYGDSVRGYGLGALGIVWCAGATWAFVDRPTRSRFVVAQLAALLAVQTYFGNCFLLPALVGGAALVCLRRRAGRTLVALGVVAFVAALSMLVDVPAVAYAMKLAPIGRGSFTFGWYARTFLGAFAPGVPALAVAWAAAGVVGVLGLGIAIASPRDDGIDRDRALYVATAAILGTVGYAGYVTFISVRTEYWYYLPVMVLLALAVEVGVDAVAARVRAGAIVRAIAVAIAAVLAAKDASATVRVRMTNLDLVARHLEEVATARDLVVVYPWYCGITFAHYYRGAAPWITVPDFPEHQYHLHALVAERMAQGDAALATELARVEGTLRDGGRVWLVGEPVAPPTGAPPPHLPPAPSGPDGWRVDPYLEGWALQLGATIRDHGGDTWRVHMPDPGPVNRWENLPLLYVEGWR